MRIAEANVESSTGLSQNLSKHLDDNHPAVFKISWIGTEAVLALEVAAARVLCGLNIVVSTPAEVMTVRTHLERVSLDTRLYGLVKLTSSLSTGLMEAR